MSADHVMVIGEAWFNSLYRYMLCFSRPHSRIQELYAYCHSAYSQPSSLFIVITVFSTHCYWRCLTAWRTRHCLTIRNCSPSVSHPLALPVFDSMLRAGVQRITNNSDLTDLTDLQWLHASLPVKDGGLGVRRVSSLALPAFLASAASTLSLRFSSRTGIYSQVGDVFGLRGPVRLPASCSGNIVSSDWIGIRISQQPRPENWWQHRRRSID